MDGIQLLSQLNACNNRGAKAAAAEQSPWQVAPQPDGRDWSQRTTQCFTYSSPLVLALIALDASSIIVIAVLAMRCDIQTCLSMQPLEL